MGDEIRKLPHSVEAEQAVLGGSMLQGEQYFDAVADRLDKEDFFDLRHQFIFEALRHLAEDLQPFDPVTIMDYLHTRKELDKAGGANYVSELATNTPSAANVLAYADIVKRYAVERRLIGVSTEVINMCYNDPSLGLREKINKAQGLMMDIEKASRESGGLIKVDDALKEMIDEVEERYESEGSIRGLTTGYKLLDEKISGLINKHLIVMAGRPSMGKSTLALNMVENVLFNSNKGVVFFTLEMPVGEVMEKLHASIGKIDYKNIKEGKLSHDEWDRLAKASTKLKGQKLFIDETPGVTPAYIKSKSRYLQKAENIDLGLIVIDYLQLMRSSNKSQSRENEVSEISRSLKEIAKQFDCPVIAMCQLSRDLERRDNKRPRPSDLRESGAIEQDADTILFVYRDEYYYEDSADKGTAEIIIGKQRSGELGMVRLQTQFEYSRFNNLAPDYRQQPELGSDHGKGALNY